jgi:hypothetical protein
VAHKVPVEALGGRGDPGPPVALFGPCRAKLAHAAPQRGVVEQPADGRRQLAGLAGRDVQPGQPVDDRVDVATTGTPQAIASSGTMPNGSYHGAVTARSEERRRAAT